MASESGVMRQVDFSHSTDAQNGRDLIRTDRFTDLYSAVVFRKQLRGQIGSRRFNKIFRFFMGRDEFFNFTSQSFIAVAGLRQKGSALAAFLIQRQVEQLINLLPMFRLHRL